MKTSWVLLVSCARLGILSSSAVAGPWPREISSQSEDARRQKRIAADKLQAELKAALARGEREFHAAPGDFPFPELRSVPTSIAPGINTWNTGHIYELNGVESPAIVVAHLHV